MTTQSIVETKRLKQMQETSTQNGARLIKSFYGKWDFKMDTDVIRKQNRRIVLSSLTM